MQVRILPPQLLNLGSHPAGSKAHRRPIGRMKAWGRGSRTQLENRCGRDSRCGFESHGFRYALQLQHRKISLFEEDNHRFLRSSLECSPPCHGGDQGFKSPRERSCREAERRMRTIWGSVITGASHCNFLSPPLSPQARPSGATGRRATLRTSCPLWAWEFDPPLGQ